MEVLLGLGRLGRQLRRHIQVLAPIGSGTFFLKTYLEHVYSRTNMSLVCFSVDRGRQ